MLRIDPGTDTAIDRILSRSAMALACLIAALVLAGCASSDSEVSGISNPNPPETIYAEADKLMDDRSYKDAAKKFEEVDRDHPYSPLARRAIVMAAYSRYKAGDYTDAIATAERYVTLHPGTKESSLAYHIIANSYYDQVKDPKRDQTRTKKALAALKIVVSRYPDSRYAEQARNRIKIMNNLLAAKEMDVGRSDLKQQNYLASINRFRTVVTEYQTTAHVEEALLRLTEAYMALGITNEAQTAAAVLGHNFPDSKWYPPAYNLLKGSGLEPMESEGSWISRTWGRMTSF